MPPDARASDAPAATPARTLAVAGVAFAVALGAWLRLHGLSIQIVQDDEWHAIHGLMYAGYGEILDAFGRADRSIPLTLLYKAMAGAFGLDEVNMRLPQVACGIALIGLCGLLAWRATRDAWTAVLLSILVADAPFLVLYSRFARPYSITTLLVLLVLAALWRWRERRTFVLGLAACAGTGLAAWLLPIAALFPAAAILYLAVQDLARGGQPLARRMGGVVALGSGAALAVALFLAAPLLHDWHSLASKAGADTPTLRTLVHAYGIFAGGLAGPWLVAAAFVTAFGAWRFFRRDAAMQAYIGSVAFAGIAAVVLLRGAWTHQAHTFARYVLPAQPILLAWFAFGVTELARIAMPRAGATAPALAAAVVASACVACTPAIRQVRELGPWYGHIYYHYDYGDPRNAAVRQYDGFRVPDFYRRLGAMAPGSAPIIEAPFTYEAPANVFAFFARFHRQPIRIGMLHDLCLEGPYVGEVPHDPRFRFREFVFLDDPAAVHASGARYLLLYREQLHSRPFVEGDRCLAALSRLYGPPIETGPRLAVFDLQPGAPPPKLQ